MTLWPRILEALEDGPGTASEIAAELGLDSRLVSVNLRALWVEGHVTRRLSHLPEPLPQNGRRTVWMYSVLDADLVSAPMAGARR